MLSDNGGVGMFLIGTTRFGDFDEKAGRQRVDVQSRGLIGGVDFRLGSGTLLGVMAGLDRSEPSLTPTSGRSKVDSWFVGAYSSLVLGPASIDLHASYGKSDLDLQRHLSVGTFAADSMAESESQQWMLAGTAAVDLGTGGIKVEPYAGARYIDLDLDGFTESGNIAALTIGQQQVQSLQSIAGLRLGAEAPATFATVRGSLTAEWRHEFEDDGARLIAGSFGGAAPFGFATTPLADDHMVVGAGLAVTGRDQVSLTVSYTGQLLGGYDVHGLTGGVRLAF
jgi:outer membrane autotransporter protein